jgi:hypothetical protein
LKASLKSITEKYQAMFSGKASSKALEIWVQSQFLKLFYKPFCFRDAGS